VDANADHGLGRVAVVAHRKKSFAGGLGELRERLAAEGVPDPLWFEVNKARKARKKARRAVKAGAGLIVVWGGDGMVQRCVDAVAGSTATIAIIPAGTANALAGNLGIPRDLAAAVRIAVRGTSRQLDLGKLNGEHFAVMAGAGFDGALIGDAGRRLKGRLGRLAYVLSGVRHLRDDPTPARIRVDGATWFTGDATCVLLGNFGTMTGGIDAFDGARPDDGCLEVGVSTARGAFQWGRTLGRMAVGRSEKSPFVETTRGRKIDVRFDEPVIYELDGGARGTTERLKARVVPRGLSVRVPAGP
jgi:YegS/Rv2252/BmrU family lipid kinase